MCARAHMCVNDLRRRFNDHHPSFRLKKGVRGLHYFVGDGDILKMMENNATIPNPPPDTLLPMDACSAGPNSPMTAPTRALTAAVSNHSSALTPSIRHCLTLSSCRCLAVGGRSAGRAAREIAVLALKAAFQRSAIAQCKNGRSRSVRTEIARSAQNFSEDSRVASGKGHLWATVNAVRCWPKHFAREVRKLSEMTASKCARAVATSSCRMTPGIMSRLTLIDTPGEEGGIKPAMDTPGGVLSVLAQRCCWSMSLQCCYPATCMPTLLHPTTFTHK